ncbi:MAG: ribonuclease HI [Planctomycetes bacterium]|nr:ribonuclease HI [Planctomycetota bacterium]
MPEFVIYTDGGCKPNPGPGGWGAVVLRGDRKKKVRELSGREDETTNNRMEITAAVEGLRAMKDGADVLVVTDSQYLRQGVTSWMKAWKRREWRTTTGEAVRNRDLWEVLDVEVGRCSVAWKWVRGHTGDRWNERADQLATLARDREGVSSGSRPFLPADRVVAHLGVSTAPEHGDGAFAVVLLWKGRERVLREVVQGEPVNRVHLRGVLALLAVLKRDVTVEVRTANRYVTQGMERVLEGAPTTRRSAYANADLWKEIKEAEEGHRLVATLTRQDDAGVERARATARELLNGS